MGFLESDFSLSATDLATLLNVGDEVGHGGGGTDAVKNKVAPASGVMTKSMVVASTSGDDKVIGTDRTIELYDAAAITVPVQIINRLNDRDKRPALQVTLKAGNNDAGLLASNVFTCDDTDDLCSDFKINDLIRLHSVMKNGENQPAMDGIHIVTAIGGGGNTLTLSAAIGDLSVNSGHLSTTREQIV